MLPDPLSILGAKERWLKALREDVPTAKSRARCVAVRDKIMGIAKHVAADAFRALLFSFGATPAS